MDNDFSTLIPTPGQTAIMRAIEAFLVDPSRQIFSVDGPAGTGKTTLLGMINTLLSGSVLSTPTNKACDVLRRKTGLTVTTVDKVVNLTKRHEEMVEMCDAEIARYVEHDWPLPPGRLVKSITYTKIDNLDATTPVVVDEASMLSHQHLQQLIAIAPKIILIGDSFQLPPVENEKKKVVA